MSAPTPWRGEMFGLAVESAVELIGCRPGWPTAAARSPAVRVETGDRASVRDALPGGGEPIGFSTDQAGRREPDLFTHPAAGYLMDVPGVAAFHVTPSGERVRAAPADVPAWLWQRHLLGRVLPFVAGLHGFEPLHASAVAGPAGALVMTGESGLGKSTLAAALVLDGFDFLADDVVALSREGERVLAHPGPSLVSVRTVAAARLGDEAVRRLGEAVGADDGSLRLAVARTGHASPVAALYVLEPVPAGRRSELIPLAAPDPARLLASTFDSVRTAPDRLVAQLDIHAALARGTRVVRAHVAPDADLRALARAIAADVASVEASV